MRVYTVSFFWVDVCAFSVATDLSLVLLLKIDRMRTRSADESLCDAFRELLPLLLAVVPHHVGNESFCAVFFSYNSSEHGGTPGLHPRTDLRSATDRLI